MSVRKRTWTTRKGEQKESWIVDYVDQHGQRTIETFERKKDADERHAAVKVDIGRGVHTVRAKTITVAQAAMIGLTTSRGRGANALLYRDTMSWPGVILCRVLVARNSPN
jgi:integrase